MNRESNRNDYGGYSDDRTFLDTALLIIDMQKAMFMNPRKQPYKGADVLKNIQTLLKTAREKHILIVFVQHTTQGKFRKGTPSWEICSALSPFLDEPVILKTKSDAFFLTDLQEILEQHHINSLLVTGMQSNFCVKQTCKGALEHGYHVTLVTDAHTTFPNLFLNAQHIVEKTNRELAKKTITLKSTDTVFTDKAQL